MTACPLTTRARKIPGAVGRSARISEHRQVCSRAWGQETSRQTTAFQRYTCRTASSGSME